MALSSLYLPHACWTKASWSLVSPEGTKAHCTDTPSDISPVPGPAGVSSSLSKNKNKNTQASKNRSGSGDVFFKVNALIFAFKPEGRLQTIFPALLLLNWALSLMPPPELGKGENFSREQRDVLPVPSLFFPPSKDSGLPGGVPRPAPPPPNEGGDEGSFSVL